MANLKDGVYIPIIDGKDIFLSNHHIKSQQAKGKKEVDYTLKCRIGEQQGKWNFKRFGPVDKVPQFQKVSQLRQEKRRPKASSQAPNHPF